MTDLTEFDKQARPLMLKMLALAWAEGFSTGMKTISEINNGGSSELPQNPYCEPILSEEEDALLEVK